jgi:hypothetical protein
VLVASCTDGPAGQSAASSASTTAPTSTTTPASTIAPDSIHESLRCDGVDPEQTISGFFEHYSEGEAPEAAAFFAEEPAFEWFSNPPDRVSSDQAWSPYDRDSLEPYFADEHSKQRQISLVDISSQFARDGMYHVGFTFERETEDAPSSPASGKAVIHCASGLLIVMSLGESLQA